MSNFKSYDPLFWTESLASELLRFLTRRVQCPDTAADLTHETYLRLHKNVQAAPVSNTRALAYRIAANLATDHQRKQNVRVRHHLQMVAGNSENIADHAAIGPERSLIAREDLKILQAALNELPTDCRTAFLLHGVHGLKYSEIAERLGISVSMVNRHLSRAMKHCLKRIR